MRVACTITLADEQRRTLERWARGRSTPVRLMQRAKIVLMAAEGKQNKDIAATLRVDGGLVGRWRRRFADKGLPGIEKDAPRSGRKPTRRAAVAAKIIQMTTQQKPADATHWSVRTLAAAAGTNRSMVHRIWQDAGLKPHLVRSFKVSRDPHFAEKLVDVVGLYLNPPEHALVLCVDEKSQIQALDRRQPGLPMKRGRCGTLTHDYRRHGTTTLFAALEMAEGRVIGVCMPKHRHGHWLKFLRLIDGQTPSDVDLHLIADNYATHKHPKVQAWLARHPRFHLHFTPTGSSWLNLVERWLRNLTQKRIRRGSFTSVQQLVDAILDYIKQYNASPRPFIWKAKAEDILAKVQRARATLHNVQSE